MPTLITLIFIWTVIVPLLALFHVLGHALAALKASRGDVLVQLGRGAAHWRWRSGRLEVQLRFLSGPVGHYRWRHTDASPRARAAVALAGPVASLVLVLLITGFGWLFQGSAGALQWLNRLGLIAMIYLMATALPWRYPRWLGALGGDTSDGLRALRLLRAAGRHNGPQ